MEDFRRKIEEKYKEPCPHFSECMNSVHYKDDNNNSIKTVCKFCFDKARIGKNYGIDARIPRIVIVGIEGLSASVEPPSLDAENAHYNGVKYVLSYLLAPYWGKDKPETRITKSSVPWIKEALSSYCLCNLYRCAFIKEPDPGMRIGLCHSTVMQDHCLEHLKDELIILDAEIVIIQATDEGAFPENTMKRNLMDSFQCEIVTGNGKEACLYKGTNNGHIILVVQTLHGAYGGFRSHTYLKEKLNPLLDETLKQYNEERNHGIQKI